MAGSTPIYGFPYPESSDLVANYPALGEQLAEDIETVLASGFGKVLQVVRATDTTRRETTSTSYVDASLSVTITPQKSTSAILLIYTLQTDTQASGRALFVQITNSANTAISGAEAGQFYDSAGRLIVSTTVIAYDTPATTSATTYKVRFRSDTGAVVRISNDVQSGQLFAIEVAA